MKKILNKNMPYYAMALGCFILLKFAFAGMDTDSITFLLGPTNKAVQLVIGSHSIYIPGSGYYHTEINTLIDKSCSGFNFMLLTFLMLVFRSITFLDKQFQKIIAIPVAMIAAYLLTIFVNSSRIIASIYIQEHSAGFFPNSMHAVIHESIGVITNLSFLIVIYYLTEKILTNKLNHAQPA